MTTKITVALATSAALGVLAVTTLASAPQQGRDVRPTTSSIDFIVVARDGHPITDLKPEEVTLRVGNKTRVIKTLQFIKVAESMVGAVGSAAAGAAAGGEPIAPAFATNIATVADAPRAIVLMVDDESIPPNQEKKLQEALNNFLRDLPPTDQVALATVPHGGIKVGFTTDRDRLRREIANISPIQPISLPPCQTLTMLGTIETTLAQLTRTIDQPVTVALLSVSLTGASAAEQSIRGVGVSAQAGACHIVADDFVRVGQTVAATRAQLYIIHPDFSIAPAADGIANLRGQTGAPLFHLQSNTEPGLSRMARETSGYYVATFDPEPDDRPGATQPTSLKAAREGVEVRARPYTVVGRPGPAANAIVVAAAPPISTWDMVRSGKMYRDLPLRGTATPFRNDDGSINVIGLFEPIDPTVKIVSAAAALVDESGQGRAVWEADADKMTSWPVAMGLNLKGEPGKYRLRVAAIDSNGRMGLIDDTLTVQLYPAGAPLIISGLMLGVTDGGGGSLQPRLQFSKEDAATAYVELYGASDGTEAGAVFELARTTNGPAFLTLRGTFAATSVEGKFGVTAKIPLAALAPGDYVVRAIVGTAKQATRVVRTLKKTG